MWQQESCGREKSPFLYLCQSGHTWTTWTRVAGPAACPPAPGLGLARDLPAWWQQGSVQHPHTLLTGSSRVVMGWNSNNMNLQLLQVIGHAGVFLASCVCITFSLFLAISTFQRATTTCGTGDPKYS